MNPIFMAMTQIDKMHLEVRMFAIMKTHGTKQTMDVPNEIFRKS